MVAPVHVSRADNLSFWDGAWNGTMRQTRWPISVTISQGKVVGFLEKGTPLSVRFTKMTPTTVTFGDELNYSTKLVRTGDATASAKVFGRHGVETGALAK